MIMPICPFRCYLQTGLSFTSIDCEATWKHCMVVWTATSYASVALPGQCTLRKLWRTLTGAHIQHERVKHSLKRPDRRCSGVCNSTSDKYRCSTENETSPQRVTRRTLGLSAAAIALGVSSFQNTAGAHEVEHLTSHLAFCWDSDQSVSAGPQHQQL